MTRTIEVHLGETSRAVGLLRFTAQGNRESAAFEYTSEWLREGYALAPTLPLVRGPQFHKRSREGSAFHDPIADTEPDGWARKIILRDHAKRRGAAKTRGAAAPAPVLTSLDYLLSVDDVSRVGALRFRDEDGAYLRAAVPGQRTTPPLVELKALVDASHAVEANRDTQADIAYLLGRGTSLGGLRPKCSVIDDDGHLAIAKFPSVQDHRAVTKGEILALALAKRAGIAAAEARLIHADTVPIALVRRFDRSGGGRVMYISGATLLGADTTAPGEHAYTELADALRAHGADPTADIAELWRRIAFSILITNIDDHLMNLGFLHADAGRWRLAPAFDLNPFPDRARELKTWISEDAGPAASIEALVVAAPHFGLSAARAKEIVAEVHRAVRTWRAVGAAIGMSADELEAFEDAFEHGERDVAARLSRGSATRALPQAGRRRQRRGR